MERKFKGGNPMEEWLQLLNAETEEELTDIEQNTTIPEIKKTVALLREMSADEQIRAEAELREKQLHDEEIAERQQTIEKLRKMGMTDEQIEAFYDTE